MFRGEGWCRANGLPALLGHAQEQNPTTLLGSTRNTFRMFNARWGGWNLITAPNKFFDVSAKRLQLLRLDSAFFYPNGVPKSLNDV